MVFSHPGAAIWTEGAAGAGAAAAEGGKSGSNHPFRWSALRISISPWPTLIQKNMVVSVNEGTPLKKNTLDWDSPWKDHSAIDATSIGDPPFMETQKVGCHLGSGKSHHFTSVPLVQRNPMMITHTPKKKKWGACVSKWKMIPPKQQFDRFWYCKYWNQIGIDGLSSY